MRLLHTKSLQFEEFFDSDIPKYAILSHRWEGKEISFHEFENSEYKKGAGFRKIREFCFLAESEGFEWCWIDTCCIDKKSSAELSEAINSMYRWYRNAQACYVYLSDVLWAEYENVVTQTSRTEFKHSAWFTRGWTLQELLAPSTVIFYDSCWVYIGTKETLLPQIATVTRIRVTHLERPMEASVATKMSWASSRETSRKEDIAYCLMGLFDINMPLLYGEGEKAFLRLQLKIIKKSNDESIFAWTSQGRSESIYNGVLATQPSAFARSGDIYRVNSSLYQNERPPYSMTQKGLAIHAPATEIQDQRKLTLNCVFAHHRGALITIDLDEYAHSGIYYRFNCHKLGLNHQLSLNQWRTFIKHESEDRRLIYLSTTREFSDVLFLTHNMYQCE